MISPSTPRHLTLRQHLQNTARASQLTKKTPQHNFLVTFMLLFDT
jgi:hypothetical protein